MVIAASPGLQTDRAPAAVFGGQAVPECGWPNVVALGGRCTGTLIHPRVVVYAAHCGGMETVNFVDNDLTGPKREVPTRTCGVFPREEGELGRDFAYCVLEEAQTDIPIVPPLMGCEVDQLVPGTEVRVVGFGLDEEGVAGVKRELTTTFDRFENEEAFITGGGDACVGDSGGPAFVRVVDDETGAESWRVFGIVSHGDLACEDGTYYGLMHVGMDWFESSSQFDLTPCTDAAGTWQPDARCGKFPTELFDLDGAWPDGCGDAARGGPVSTCGTARSEEVDDLPPTIEFVTPEADLQVATDPEGNLADVAIELVAEDASGIAELRLRVDGEVIPGGARGLGPYTYEPSFPQGLYEVDAVAEDYAGNVAVSELRLVAVDTPLPESEDEGCACRTRTSPPGWWLALLPLFTRRRRYSGAGSV